MSPAVTLTIVLSAVLPAVLRLLLGSGSGDADLDGDRRVLGYTPILKGFCWFLLLAPAILIAIVLVSPPPAKDRWIPLQLILGFFALWAPLSWEVLRRRVELTRDFIAVVSPWVGTARMRWVDVSAVRWTASRGLEIRSRTGRRLHVTGYLAGKDTLADELERLITPGAPGTSAVLTRFRNVDPGGTAPRAAPGDGTPSRGDLRRTTPALLDAALDDVRTGRPLDEQAFDRCGAAFAALDRMLVKLHGTTSAERFPESDRVLLYEQLVKLTAMGHPDYDASTLASPLRPHVLAGLRRKFAEVGDPWTCLCLIQPALVAGQVDLALAAYRRIAATPWLHRLARAWADGAAMAFADDNPQDAVARFLERLPPAPDPWAAEATALPAATRWILCASIFPFLWIEPRTKLADARNPAAQRIGLREAWSVVDGESARRCLDLLLHVGHRAELAEMLAAPGGEASAQAAFVRDHRQELERRGIAAWDLGRLVQVARSAFSVGYLDDAVWDWLQAAGRGLRQEYASWDEYAEAYVLGAQFFEGTDEPGNQHVSMARWLQRSPRSPWRDVPFGG